MNSIIFVYKVLAAELQVQLYGHFKLYARFKSKLNLHIHFPGYFFSWMDFADKKSEK